MDIYYVEENNFLSSAPIDIELLELEDFEWSMSFACIQVENYTLKEAAIAIFSVGLISFATTQLLNDISTVPMINLRFFKASASIMSGLILGQQVVPLKRFISNNISCMRARPRVIDSP